MLFLFFIVLFLFIQSILLFLDVVWYLPCSNETWFAGQPSLSWMKFPAALNPPLLGEWAIPRYTVKFQCHPINLGIAMINHSFWMVYTTHLWWFGGWFIIVIPTLMEINHGIQSISFLIQLLRTSVRIEDAKKSCSIPSENFMVPHDIPGEIPKSFLSTSGGQRRWSHSSARWRREMTLSRSPHLPPKKRPMKGFVGLVDN